MSDHQQDTRKRKAGGPAERLQWLQDNAGMVSAGAFRVLVILTNHAKNNGTSYPSWGRLEELTGVAHSSIDRQLAELKAAGLVSVIHSGKGSRTVNTYQLSGAVDGWVSSPASGTTQDTPLVPSAGLDSSRQWDLSSPASGTGNPNKNKKERGEATRSFISNIENQPTKPADRLKAGAGLVDSLLSEGDRDESKIAEIQVQALAAKVEKDKAEAEAIPPCHGCGRAHWTPDIAKERHAVKTGSPLSNRICFNCPGAVADFTELAS